MALYQLNQETHTYVKSLLFNVNAFSTIMVSRCFSEINALPSILFSNYFIRLFMHSKQPLPWQMWLYGIVLIIDSIP